MSDIPDPPPLNDRGFMPWLVRYLLPLAKVTGGDLTALQNDVTTLTGLVNTNTSGVASNASDIATNAADIATNTADIATNAADIAALEALVEDHLGNLDAFERMRVSGTGQLLDVEFLYDKQPDFFDEVTNNGTVTHNSNSRDLTLSLGDANNGSYATMRSHPVPYTPGNSQFIAITGTLDLAGVGGGTAQVFLRSNVTGSVVETTVDQTSWNVDTAASVDWETSQIFAIDFQSLKVGRIRFYLDRDGSFVHVHSIVNDNLRAGGYWQFASLPAYWRLHTTSGTTYMEVGYGDESNAVGFRYAVSATASATMRAICCTVKTEGGIDLKDQPGLQRSIDNGVTPKTISTTLIPVLSIRQRALFNSLTNMSIGMVDGFGVSTDNPIRLVIVQGGALTGASWANVSTNYSSVEYDTSATVLTGGRTVFSGYFTGVSKNTASAATGELGKSVMWDRLGAETGIVTIAAVRASGTDASVLASLQWREIR